MRKIVDTYYATYMKPFVFSYCIESLGHKGDTLWVLLANHERGLGELGKGMHQMLNHGNKHHIPMSEYHTFGTSILFAQ